MAAPGTPVNFIVQQANSQVLLSWDLTAGATSYPVYRSTDGTTYSLVSSPVVNQYLDTAVVAGTNYYYKINATNSSGSSPFTSPAQITPVKSGVMTLGQIRLLSQQKADRVGSNFVGTAEWNTYINQSAFELYDLLTTEYEDYFVANPVTITTNGGQSYSLTTYAPDFYKLLGVDMSVTSGQNSWVTLKRYNFIARNRYIYPTQNANALGVYNLAYRIMGDNLTFIPTPSGTQYFRIWYVPRMTMLLRDTDQLDGVSGWTEYIVIDAAIKALQKEESDVSILMAQKQMIIDRIQSAAMNRDAGEPNTISSTRSNFDMWGYGGGDGPMGGM